MTGPAAGAFHTQFGFGSALRAARVLAASPYTAAPAVVSPSTYEVLRKRWVFNRYQDAADNLGISRAWAEAVWEACGHCLTPESRARWALDTLMAGIVMNLDLIVVPPAAPRRALNFQFPHPAHGVLRCPTCTNTARKAGQ